MSKKINIISPFGPKLAKIKLSKKVVNDINQEVERIILNEKKSKKKDYSKKLVGEVYQEIELSKNFINGSRMFLNKSIYNHVPKVGDLILFPNYLMHTAYPFVVDGERRSFSFNVELDKKVADVFHD